MRRCNESRHVQDRWLTLNAQQRIWAIACLYGWCLDEQRRTSPPAASGPRERRASHADRLNAKIIDVRRDPMACCVSTLRQLFAKGQEFSYGIEDIARYYRAYLELMRHWDVVLPGRILRLCYEGVVEDLQGNAQRILEFCGLEFEPACVEFYNADRAVSTASSEQVRQPIFGDGLYQWRNFEPWLGPLKDKLGDALIRYHE